MSSEITTAEAPSTQDAGATATATKPRRASKPKANKNKPRKVTKPSANGKGKRVIGKMQYRILKLLAKKQRATRPQLVTAATGREDGTMDATALGAKDPKQRRICEGKSGRPSLITLGFVRIREIEKPESETGAMETWYEITSAGKKALANYDK
jgi:hypothetical protein